MVSLVFAVLLGTVVLTAHVVEDDERAILLNNDEFVRVVQPGIVWLIPKIERLDRVSMSSVSLRRQLILTDADQRSAKVDLLVTYHHDPDQVYEIFRRYGSNEAHVYTLKGMCFDRRYIGIHHKDLSKSIDELAQSVFAQYTEFAFKHDPTSQFIQGRTPLNMALEFEVKDALKNQPIVIEDVVIDKINVTGE